jgi:glycosyltransferase involved in cell wall biosynthesis
MVLDDFLNSEPDCELRRDLGIPENAPVVVAVARLFPLKGYEYFVPAAQLIAAKLPNTCFLIVGDGVMTEMVKSQAMKLGLNFVFAGLVPPSEVHRYIAISDILAHLSLREGLPRAVVQALACGKPAISFDLDGAPEVIIPGETGYLVEPKNSAQVAEFVVELLRDNKRRDVMGAKGKSLVSDKFDWSRMGKVLEAEYKKYVAQIRLRTSSKSKGSD